jgi:hypothetical protein
MTQYMKAIISNKYVEVTQQSSPPFVRRTSSGGRKSFSNQSIENYEANLKVSINRARKRIRRLLECNFTDQYAFVTLTFKPSEEIDVTDIKICHKMFCDFKKRLTYYLQKNQLPEFKYLGVIEFQDENRQGAVHYHLVCNLIEIPLGTLQELWQNGWVYRSIVKSDVLENEKIVHYLNKGITDKRLRGKKSIFTQKVLNSPLLSPLRTQRNFMTLLISLSRL